MSASKHTIIPIQPPDLPASASLIHASKLALTINRLLYKNWPATEVQEAQCLNAVTNAAQDPTMETFKVVDPETQELIGYLALSRKQPKEEGETPVVTVDEKFEKGIIEWVNKASSALRGDFEKKDHFRLTFICVKLENRLQGIGSELVQLAIEKAKAEGIPLAVTSEPASYEFFKKLGFKEGNHHEIDLSEHAPPYSGFGAFRLTGMLWSPKK